MSPASHAVYLLPIIEVHAGSTEKSSQSQASAWELPLLFQDPAPAGRAVLWHRTRWGDVCRAKGFSPLVSEELAQLQVLGAEEEALLLLFKKLCSSSLLTPRRAVLSAEL